MHEFHATNENVVMQRTQNSSTKNQGAAAFHSSSSQPSMQ